MVNTHTHQYLTEVSSAEGFTECEHGCGLAGDKFNMTTFLLQWFDSLLCSLSPTHNYELSF